MPFGFVQKNDETEPAVRCSISSVPEAEFHACLSDRSASIAETHFSTKANSVLNSVEASSTP